MKCSTRSVGRSSSDPRGGAGGVIGTDLVSRAAPNGKTLLMGSLGSHVISALIQPSVKYDPVASFDAIAMVGYSPTLMVTAQDLPTKNFAEFVSLAKTKPMSLGSAGIGSTMHIAGELFNQGSGTKVAHVPYRGVSVALPDLLAGRLDMIAADPPVLLPLVEQNQVRPLAVFGHARLRALPDVPTTVELGYPDMIMENWYGLLAPAGLPAEVKAKLENAALAAIAAPAVQVHMAKGELTGTPDSKSFKAWIEKDVTTWRKAVVALGIAVEGEAAKSPSK